MLARAVLNLRPVAKAKTRKLGSEQYIKVRAQELAQEAHGSKEASGGTIHAPCSAQCAAGVAEFVCRCTWAARA